jgi:hypothetical protein
MNKLYDDLWLYIFSFLSLQQNYKHNPTTSKSMYNLLEKYRKNTTEIIFDNDDYQCESKINNDVFKKFINKNVKKIIARNTKITDVSLQLLKNHCNSITHLDLCESYRLTDINLLKDLPLRFLNIKRCFKTTNMSVIKNFPLTHLNISDRGYYELKNIFSELNELPLTELIIRDNNDIIDFNNLEKFKELKILDLNSLGGVKLSHLPQSLLQLSLCNTKVSDNDIKILQNTKITDLNISYCTDITDESLFFLRDLSIIKLNIAYCHQLTSKAFENLQYLPLTHLKLEYNRQIKDSDLSYLKNLPLQYLNISMFDHDDMDSLSEITNDGLMHLQNMPLQHLILGSSKITSAGITHLKKCPLKRLTLNRCIITDEVFKYINDIKTLIRFRTFWGGCEITFLGLKKYLKNKKMITVDISSSNLSYNSEQLLRSLYPDLVIECQECE